MPIPCSVVDLAERFTLINKSYEKVFRINRKDLLGRHYSCHVLPEEKSIHRVVLREKRPYSGVKKMGQNGQLVQVDGYPVSVDGEMVCSIAIMHEFSSVSRSMLALENVRAMIWNGDSLHARHTFDDIIYKSEIMNNIIQKAIKAANTNVTVLLRGESGTGKELFAHAIHAMSARSQKSFVRVNCTAIPESLLESVLFGYVSGAFTGAKKGGEVGLFEAAEGGTIFLDEIGDIGLSLQMKLLRVLQEKEFTRVGDTKAKYADVRIIAATNVDLEGQIQKNAFRSDLYYRLNIFPVFIPPLRDRREDIPLITRQFVTRYAQEYNRGIISVSEKCMQKLLSHNWPGNIRELENAVARAIIDAETSQNELYSQNVSFLSESRPARGAGLNDPGAPAGFTDDFTDKTRDYKDLFSGWEKAMLESMWRQERKNKTKIARRLQISVRSLYQKLKNYCIN
jgi:transcriptional regulator with PAS, ATPase and Fis domain